MSWPVIDCTLIGSIYAHLGSWPLVASYCTQVFPYQASRTEAPSTFKLLTATASPRSNFTKYVKYGFQRLRFRLQGNLVFPSPVSRASYLSEASCLSGCASLAKGPKGHVSTELCDSRLPFLLLSQHHVFLSLIFLYKITTACHEYLGKQGTS
jgi:hypothetical protein